MAILSTYSSVEEYQLALGANLDGTGNLGSFDVEANQSGFIIETVANSTTVNQSTTDRISNTEPLSNTLPYSINLSESFESLDAVGFDIGVFDSNAPEALTLDILYVDGTFESQTVNVISTPSDPAFFGVISDRAISQITFSSQEDSLPEPPPTPPPVEFNTFSTLAEYQSALGSENLSGTENLGSFDEPRSSENTDFVVEAVGSSTTSSTIESQLINLFDSATNSPIGSQIIQFEQPVNAVGLDIGVFDPATPQTLALDILLADGTSRTETLSTSPTESEPGFFGVISDQAISQITFTSEDSPVDPSPPNPPSPPSPPDPITTPIEIDGPNTVPYEIFNVLVPGTIQVNVTPGSGSPQEGLTVTLDGPIEEPIVDDSPPYSLTYEVTEADIARGISWRVEVDSGDNTEFQGNIEISVPTASDERIEEVEQNRISLQSGDIFPNETLQNQFLEELEGLDESLEGKHGIISFSQTPTASQLQQLEAAGIERKSILSNGNVYGFVRKDFNPNDPNLDPNVAELIDFVTPLEAEQKIAPDILVGNYDTYFLLETNENYVLNDDGSLNLSVIFAEGTPDEEINSILEQAQAISSFPISETILEITIQEENIGNLAAQDQVEWISSGSPPSLLFNSNTRSVTKVDNVQNAQVDGGLTGENITVGVNDSGIASHPDLEGKVVGDATSDRSTTGHGTHVAGTVAGTGTDSPNNSQQGVAPKANLFAAYNGDESSLVINEKLKNAITNNSLDLVNHSHALGEIGEYDFYNQTVDGQIANISGVRRIPRISAAGNNGLLVQYPRDGIPIPLRNNLGYYSIGNQLKNAVVVGDWDASDGDGNFRNDKLSARSSLGPTYDGRLKPDVVAPGTNISSTTNNGAGYVLKSGTSFAAPAVAGIHALLLEGWQNTYSTPQGTTIDEQPPLPSTLRGLLIHTATDIVDDDVRRVPGSPRTPQNEQAQAPSLDIDSDSDPSNGNDGRGLVTATVGPDYATGWGLVNAEAAVNLMQNSGEENNVPIPNQIKEKEVVTLGTGEREGGTKEYKLLVDENDAANPLKVTLAWDDVEKAVQDANTANTVNTANIPKLVNDLDLELVAPDGTTFYPWQLGHTVDAEGNPNLPTISRTEGITTTIVRREPTQVNTLIENIPANALTGDGFWVAKRVKGPLNDENRQNAKDSLNNVEQVLVDPEDVQAGEWTVRVIGFDVEKGNTQDGTAQDFSLIASSNFSEAPPEDDDDDAPPAPPEPGDGDEDEDEAPPAPPEPGDEDDDDDFIESDVSYTLQENERNLRLIGNDAIDGTGNSLDNIIIGNDADNILSGLEGNDTLEGRGGDDVLDGGTGDDSMSGNAGNDIYIVDSTNDVVVENADEGIDTINAAFDYTLGENLENLNLLEGVANGIGNELDNIIIGNNSDNTLNGEAGNDILIGLVGNDAIFGGDGNDSILGGLGNESPSPENPGEINGVAGSDTLTGGSGNDAFVYTDMADTGDLITDFTVGEDRIVLTELLQSMNYAGSNPIADGTLGFIQANDNLAVIQMDADGAASDIFRPVPSIYLENVSVGQLNNANNFEI